MVNPKQWIKKTLNRLLVRPRKLPASLHLGCGWVHLDGWCNVDIQPWSSVDVVDDVAFLRRFRPASVDRIYACHVLEHFPHGETAVILSRWFTLLKPGGELRISVPDMDAIVRIYNAHLDHFHTQGNTPWVGLIYGGQGDSKDFHMAGFNYCWLRFLLEGAGFTAIETYPHQPHFIPGVTDSSLANQPFGEYISLNVKAVKPV